MTGIGNDIIALRSTDPTRTRTPRFYTKFLAEPEQQLYPSLATGLPFDHFVWLLWSVKESTYKYLQRQQPGLTFKPVSFVIHDLQLPSGDASAFTSAIQQTGFNDIPCYTGTVSYGLLQLPFRSIIFGDELIHTVVADADSFATIHWGIQQITATGPDSHSVAVRRLLTARLSQLLPAHQFTIEKHTSGYPYLLMDDPSCDILISLSHHGEFVGYAVKV